MAGIDRSLAFTALLEHDEEFRGMDMNASGERITEYLNDWEAAGRPPMFEHTREWVAERKALAADGERAERSYGMLDPNGQADEYVCLPAEPDERQVMDWGEHNAMVDSEVPDHELGQLV